MGVEQQKGVDLKHCVKLTVCGASQLQVDGELLGSVQRLKRFFEQAPHLVVKYNQMIQVRRRGPLKEGATDVVGHGGLTLEVTGAPRLSSQTGSHVPARPVDRKVGRHRTVAEYEDADNQ
jgi:hypothetical protein